jgi:transposase
MEFKNGKRIFVIPGWTDSRKQIKGLTELLQRLTTAKKLFGGNYFIFCNKRRNSVKIMYWDFDGFCLLQKKYDDRFFWPSEARSGPMERKASDIRKLLHGVNIWSE